MAQTLWRKNIEYNFKFDTRRRGHRTFRSCDLATTTQVKRNMIGQLAS